MKKTILYMAAVAAITLASCSDGIDEIAESQDTVALKIELDDFSRATLLNALPNGAEYCIKVGKEIRTVKYSNGVSTLASPVVLTRSNQRVDAFYPYSKDNADRLQSEDMLKINAASDVDFLYGQSSSSVSIYSPTARIKFHHAFTDVVIKITPNSYLAEDLKNEIVIDNVRLKNVALSGCVSTSGSYSFDAVATKDFGKIGKRISDGNIEVSTLAMPYNSSDKTDKVIEIYVSSQSDPLVVTIPYSKWQPQAGKRYTYTVTIDGAHEASLGLNVIVNEWKTSYGTDVTIK